MLIDIIRLCTAQQLAGSRASYHQAMHQPCVSHYTRRTGRPHTRLAAGAHRHHRAAEALPTRGGPLAQRTHRPSSRKHGLVKSQRRAATALRRPPQRTTGTSWSKSRSRAGAGTSPVTRSLSLSRLSSVLSLLSSDICGSDARRTCTESYLPRSETCSRM